MSTYAEPVVAWRGSTSPVTPLVVHTTAIHDPGGHALSAHALAELQQWLTTIVADAGAPT